MHPLLKIDGCTCTLFTRYYKGPEVYLEGLSGIGSTCCNPSIWGDGIGAMTQGQESVYLGCMLIVVSALALKSC